MHTRTIPLPSDEFTLDLLCECLAKMFEIDRRKTAATSEVSADRDVAVTSDAPALEPDAQEV